MKNNQMKIYGKNPVIERLKKDPGSIRKLYLQQKTELSKVVKAAKAAKIDFQSINKEEMFKITGKVHSQGVVALIDEFVYTPYDELLGLSKKEGIIPVFLDGITDPHNLGSIIRSLACLGGFSVVLPEHNSVDVNETVLRVACGGENHIMISMIPNNVKGAAKAKSKGFWIAGAVADGGEDISKCDLKKPFALVVGAEGKGIRPGLQKILDGKLTIPMKGADLSFNVAVATALVCYELIRD